MRRTTRGFTLIELILVIAIIGILSVIGIGSFTTATTKSRDTQRKGDLNQIAKALELFNNDVGRYPNVDGSGAMMCPQYNLPETTCLSLIYAYIGQIRAVYMTVKPTDPDTSKIYKYVLVGSGFALYAALENTQDRDVVTVTVNGVSTPSDWGISCAASGSGAPLCNYKLTETGVVRTKP